MRNPLIPNRQNGVSFNDFIGLLAPSKVLFVAPKVFMLKKLTSVIASLLNNISSTDTIVIL
mgnify:CR=1 FL=1